MIKDRVVRIKLKRYCHEQKPISYVGKVTAISEQWLIVDARTVVISRNQPNGVQIDKRNSAMMLPWGSIESVRVLPDNFDVNNIRVTTEGSQLRIIVDGALDAYLGEMGEG